MKELVLLGTAALVVAGCATPSTTLQNASGQTVECSSSGYGYLGAPMALASHAKCVERMQAMGYRAVDARSVQPSPVSTGENISLDLGAEWERRTPPNSELAQGIYAINPVRDIGVYAGAVDKSGVDLMAYAASRRTTQENLLANPVSSEIEKLDVNGRLALRSTTRGVTKGYPVTYMYTIVEGSEKLAVVNTWTSTNAFSKNSTEMSQLVNRIIGLN